MVGDIKQTSLGQVIVSMLNGILDKETNFDFQVYTFWVKIILQPTWDNSDKQAGLPSQYCPSEGLDDQWLN